MDSYLCLFERELEVDVSATQRNDSGASPIVRVELRKNALDVILDCVLGNI